VVSGSICSQPGWEQGWGWEEVGVIWCTFTGTGACDGLMMGSVGVGLHL